MRNQLNMAMDEVVKAQDELTRVLFSCRELHVESYMLPDVAKDDEVMMINVQPESVHIDIYHSFSLAVTQMLDIYAHDDASTRFSSRHPGVVILQADPENQAHCTRCAINVDVARDQFVKLTQVITNKKERFDLVHECFPYLNVNNMRRKIRVYQDIENIAFSWANKPIITHASVDAVSHKIKQHKEKNILYLGDPQGVHLSYDDEIAAVLDVPVEETLRYVRPVRVQPIVSIDGKAESCPVPIIVFADKGNLPAVKSLTHYDAKVVKKRGKKSHYVPVVPRIHLYQKEDA